MVKDKDKKPVEGEIIDVEAEATVILEDETYSDRNLIIA